MLLFGKAAFAMRAISSGIEVRSTGLSDIGVSLSNKLNLIY
jgi:hypothetical protein